MKKISRISIRVLCVSMLLFITFFKQVVLGATIQDSILVTGTQSLAEAIIGWLTGIGITVCGGYFIYYVYCLKTNDEGERRRNIQNIKTTLIAMVLITCGLAVINTILGFYK